MQIRRFGMAAFAAVLLLSAPVFAQLDTSYQVHTFENIGLGTGNVINMTNTGATINQAFPLLYAAGGLSPSGPNTVYGSGYICVNAYVFSHDEQLQSCCSCLMSPDSHWSWNVDTDMVAPGITLTGVPLNEVTVKLITTLGSKGQACDPTTAGQPTVYTISNSPGGGTPATLAPPENSVTSPGLLAFGRNAFNSEFSFSNGTLSMSNQVELQNGQHVIGGAPQSELTRDANLCASNTFNGSGFGVCKSCRLGGL